MDAPPEVAAANAAARAMLRDHLRDYVERNGDDASYEAWIATVHPENVRLDDRLRLPQSEHRAMWDARPRVTTASRQASGGGLVALLVGAVFAFAVFAAALAFIAARAPLFFGARALSRLRGALRAYSMRDDDADVECLSSRLLAGVAAVFLLPVELALYIADTGVAFGEEAALQLLSAFGGLFIALFALSPKAGAAGRTRLAEQRAAALRRCGLERAAPPTLRERLACRRPADGASELADGV
jgi:hypothetical protein